MLSERLISLRKQKGLSQYELAERLGFSRGKLSNYEQGSRQPDYETLQKLADFFEVTTDYLLGRSNDRESSDEEEFRKFADDPDLQNWYYKELPHSDEDKLRQLRKMWEIMKDSK